MNKVTSNDGTTIAYDKAGTGPAVVLIQGGPVDRQVHTELAGLLAERLTVYNYDRRGRGDSGDTAPYALEREYEDLDAVIAAAGGSAMVFGNSGGMFLALQAAARGSAVTRLVGWEPPYILPGTRPAVPADYLDRQRALLAEDRRGEMVELFLTAAVGLPEEFVAAIKQFPGWADQLTVAHTLVYDAILAGDFSLPATELATVTAPALILDGGTVPWISQSAEAVAVALPAAERETLTGQQHNVEPAAIAPAIISFLTREG